MTSDEWGNIASLVAQSRVIEPPARAPADHHGVVLYLAA
jgi:hypothetical protein